ncbi:MAG: hypothetical protein AB8H80_05830 [Planctomycetota bacterium]
MRRASGFACIAVAAAYGAHVGSRLESGLGFWPDIVIALTATLLLVLLLPSALRFSQALGKVAEDAFGALGTSALLTTFLLLTATAFSPQIALYLIALVALPLSMLAGGTVSASRGDFGKRRKLVKVCIFSITFAGLAGAGIAAWWLTSDGSSSHLAQKPDVATSNDAPELFAMPSPGAAGPLTYQIVRYGSGQDQHRDEFGANVEIRTEPVNARPFVKMPKGWRGRLRKQHLGYDAGALPLNGTAWVPQGAGPFPLVLCVHGNHRMHDASDPGYAYLGELLASRGFLFVSVDQNFLNSGGLLHGSMRGENDARAWLLLEHMAQWRRWNNQPNHRLHGLANLKNVALIGHSRGGEAVCIATLFNRLRHYPDDASVSFDYGFGIQSVVSIAPVDGQYQPADHRTAMRDTSFLTMHGGHDADVTSFHGDRLYSRLQFSANGTDCFKSAIWIYRANHGQFNTTWGGLDSPPPRAWLLNDAALMPGHEQRTVARVFVGAFLEATLHDEAGFHAIFRDTRVARDLLPAAATVISQYEDATFRVLADYEEDVDVVSATAEHCAIQATGFEVWREKDIPMRGKSKRRNHGVELGWNRSDESDAPLPSYELSLSERFTIETPLTIESVLTFAIAASDAEPRAQDYASADAKADDTAQPEADDNDGVDQDPITLSVEIEDSNGRARRRPLHQFGTLRAPLQVAAIRTGLSSSSWEKTFEPILQTFRCPLRAFATENFEPSQIRAIRLIFDQTKKGTVFVDRIGFAR